MGFEDHKQPATLWATCLAVVIIPRACARDKVIDRVIVVLLL